MKQKNQVWVAGTAHNTDGDRLWIWQLILVKMLLSLGIYSFIKCYFQIALLRSSRRWWPVGPFDVWFDQTMFSGVLEHHESFSHPYLYLGKATIRSFSNIIWCNGMNANHWERAYSPTCVLVYCTLSSHCRGRHLIKATCTISCGRVLTCPNGWRTW